MFPRLTTLTATGRSTAHTKCRNEVKDLKRSVELCGWAVADDENEAGKLIEEVEFAEPVERRSGKPFASEPKPTSQIEH